MPMETQVQGLVKAYLETCADLQSVQSADPTKKDIFKRLS